MTSFKSMVLKAISVGAAAWLVACVSSSPEASQGEGSPPGKTCPKLPLRDLADGVEGMVICEAPASSSNERMLVCKNGEWQPLLDCGTQTTKTEGGFTHTCKCYDPADGTQASCGFLTNDDCGITVKQGETTTSSSSGATSSSSGSSTTSSSGSTTSSSGGIQTDSGAVARDGG